MIFGRSTVIIMAAIVATMQLVKQGVLLAFPGLDPGAVSNLGDLFTAAIGAWIAVLAFTSTTPTADPMLQVGTVVQATDPSTGVVVGHVKVPEPAPAPLAVDVGPGGEDADALD